MYTIQKGRCDCFSVSPLPLPFAGELVCCIHDQSTMKWIAKWTKAASVTTTTTTAEQRQATATAMNEIKKKKERRQTLVLVQMTIWIEFFVLFLLFCTFCCVCIRLRCALHFYHFGWLECVRRTNCGSIVKLQFVVKQSNGLKTHTRDALRFTVL